MQLVERATAGAMHLGLSGCVQCSIPKAHTDLLLHAIVMQLVERANAWAAHLGLSRRVQYLQADAAAQLQRLLDSYSGQLELVTVQFPDPQHHRDRLVSVYTAVQIFVHSSKQQDYHASS